MAVELAPGAGDNGLAVMMATLMGQNLEDHPDRKPDFDRLIGRVAIVAEDAGVALTMEMEKGRVVVHDGIVGIPDLTIRGDSEIIADMSRMETGRFGLPDPRGEVNRAMVSALRERRLRIYGLPSALPLLVRFGKVLAIE